MEEREKKKTNREESIKKGLQRSKKKLCVMRVRKISFSEGGGNKCRFWTKNIDSLHIECMQITYNFYIGQCVFPFLSGECELTVICVRKVNVLVT